MVQLVFQVYRPKSALPASVEGAQRAPGHEALRAGDMDDTKLSRVLREDMESLKSALGNGDDLKTHPIRFGPDNGLSGALIFVDDLVDNAVLTDAILRPLQN